MSTRLGLKLLLAGATALGCAAATQAEDLGTGGGAGTGGQGNLNGAGGASSGAGATLNGGNTGGSGPFGGTGGATGSGGTSSGPLGSNTKVDKTAWTTVTDFQAVANNPNVYSFLPGELGGGWAEKSGPTASITATGGSQLGIVGSTTTGYTGPSAPVDWIAYALNFRWPVGTGSSKIITLYDASQYAGVELDISGSGKAKLLIVTYDSLSTADGGACTGDCFGYAYPAASDAYLTGQTGLRVPFSSFVQPTWATPAPTLNVGRLISLKLYVEAGSGSFNYTIDNLKLY